MSRVRHKTYKTSYFFSHKDLNRDFLSFYDKKDVDSGADINTIFSTREHETQLVMRWILDHPFVLSANFHDGAVLANVSFLLAPLTNIYIQILKFT